MKIRGTSTHQLASRRQGCGAVYLPTSWNIDCHALSDTSTSVALTPCITNKLISFDWSRTHPEISPSNNFWEWEESIKVSFHHLGWLLCFWLFLQEVHIKKMWIGVGTFFARTVEAAWLVWTPSDVFAQKGMFGERNILISQNNKFCFFIYIEVSPCLWRVCD